MADRGVGDARGPQRVAKDMSISHAEFFRTVRPLLEGETHEVHAGGVTILRDGSRIEIRLGPEGARRLGHFHLPRTEVEIEFRGCTPEQAEAFLSRFDMRFRRGGG